MGCEVTLWWCFYLFSVAATGDVLNWTFVGPLFLSGLFVLPRASLDVTETLSSRKYKAYPEYQRRVSRFIPWPPQGIADTLADRFLVGWFVVGFCITHLIDMEQVVVQDPAKYGLPGHTPWWPPAPCVRAIHWRGHTADRLVLARPVWFQAGIWLEIVVQAPFYALAIFAFVQRRSWIRTPPSSTPPCCSRSCPWSCPSSTLESIEPTSLGSSPLSTAPTLSCPCSCCSGFETLTFSLSKPSRRDWRAGPG